MIRGILGQRVFRFENFIYICYKFIMKIFLIILTLFSFSLANSLTLKSSKSSETQKILEKGLMELTNEETGEVSYKILWKAPDGTDSFWLRAVPANSPDAFQGNIEELLDPDAKPLEAISQSYSSGNFTVTEEGMERAVRAVNDVWISANVNQGGGNSSSGSGGGSGGAC